MHVKSKAKRKEDNDEEKKRAQKETSKLEDTVKADDSWLCLETSESEILPEDFAAVLQYQYKTTL